MDHDTEARRPQMNTGMKIDGVTCLHICGGLWGLASFFLGAKCFIDSAHSCISLSEKSFFSREPGRGSLCFFCAPLFISLSMMSSPRGEDTRCISWVFSSSPASLSLAAPNFSKYLCVYMPVAAVSNYITRRCARRTLYNYELFTPPQVYRRLNPRLPRRRGSGSPRCHPRG